MIKIEMNNNVYIKNIGFATLLQCPNKQYITIQDSSYINNIDPLDSLNNLFEPQQSKPSQVLVQDIKLTLIPSGYLVYTRSCNITNSINLKVKIFFDKRQIVNIIIPINTTVEQLKKKLFQNLNKNPDMFYKTRLFWASAQLTQLQDFKQIWEYNVQNNTKLVMTTNETFAFTAHTDSLIIVKKQTLQKMGDQTYSTIMSNAGWAKTGKYYWQIRIDKCDTEEDVFIGVAHKDIDKTGCPTHSKYWGILPLFAKKFSPLDVGNLINYGSVFKLGQNIGILVSFSNNLASISFYKNGISLGTAFQQVQGVLYPVVTLFGSSDKLVQVSYDPKAPMPIIN